MQFPLKVLLFLLLFGPQSQASDAPDPKRLDANALSHRRQILRGELEIDCEGWVETPPAGKVSYAHSLSLAFDGKLKRGILVRKAATLDGKEWRPAQKEIRCYGEKEHIWFSDAKSVDGTRSMLSLVELGHLKEHTGLKVVDPRTLGHSPMGVLNLVYSDLDSGVGNTAYKSITIAKESYKESDCWKITKVRPSDSIVRIWFDPAKDFAVSKIEAEAELGGVKQIDAVESELVYFDSIKQWFPRVCRFTSKINGATTAEETARVKVTQFQGPVDRGKFTMAGLVIPVGTRIAKTPSQAGSFTWDGQKIINTIAPTSALPAVERPRTEDSSWRWTLLVGFFSVGSAVCLILLWKDRSR